MKIIAFTGLFLIASLHAATGFSGAMPDRAVAVCSAVQPVIVQNTYKVSGVVYTTNESKRRNRKEMVEEVTVVAYKVLRDEDGKIARLVVPGEDFVQNTDSKGRFGFKLSGDTEYSIRIIKEGFTASPVPFGKKNVADGEFISIEIELFEASNTVLKGTCLEQGSNQPIAGVNVKLASAQTGVMVETTTLQDGSFRFGLAPDEDYKLHSHKQKYFYNHPQYIAPADSTAATALAPLTVWMKEVSKGQTMTIEEFFFPVNEATLTTEGQQVLDNFLPLLLENPFIQFELGCHSDSRGNDNYNLQLTEKRAKASVAYLVSMGVQPGQVIAKGYGEQQLMNHCANGVRCSTRQHQQNRRLELKVLGITE